jgi:APA family basic amino acid/polyamine antiporter
MIVTGARIYQAMAEDGLFFAPLARLHPASRVPVTALVTQGLVSAVVLCSGSFETILEYATVSMILSATFAVIAVFVLRVRRPDAPRPFRTPGYPVVPLFFVIANVWVLGSVVAAGSRAALAGVAVIASGVPAFVLFQRASRARRDETR